jgi:nucleotide-binding universal stress UspA family protein
MANILPEKPSTPQPTHYKAGIPKKEDIELETDVAVGNPADQIIHRAEEVQASLIVMGRRGRSAIQRWVLGSNSERVLRYAHCPVMVVH